MNRQRWIFALVAVSGLACGSASSSAGPEVRATLAQAESSAAEPAATGPATDAEIGALTDGNTDFALTLYSALRGGAGNLFFSPHSISTALAMTYAGAEGETARAMAETLRFGLPAPRLHAAFEGLAEVLASRAEGAPSFEEGDRFQLTVANALWAQRDYEFLPSYVELTRERYGAPVERLDFVNDNEGARQTINGWVSEQTAERIPELLMPGTIDALTRLVLTNAIYFNVSWATHFPESATLDAPFHAPGGDVTVSMMRRVAGARWARAGDVTVVELPYLGGEVVMTVLMPDEGALEDLEAALDRDALDDLLEPLRSGEVDLSFPRFESGSAIRLSRVLRALGMGVAFSDAADFSGMTGTQDLAISDVIHQANITVDESGTEAAAATAVVMRTTAARPSEPEVIVVDRPFIYLIRDRGTGAVLFMGRLVNPS